MERSWNDGSKTQYYIVILDRLQDRSRGLERAPESRIRGLLTEMGKTIEIGSVSCDEKYPFNNIISFLFYIITNFSLLNTCYLLL